MPSPRSPFAPLAQSIPVTVVTDGALKLNPSTALLTLTPALHDHAPGAECPACAARSDIRAMLFDLLSSSRLGTRPPFTAVLVDARTVADPQPIIDRLRPGIVPAIGLRDHTVARSFHLA